MAGTRLIGIGLIVALLSAPCMAGDASEPPTRTISVTGTATVKVVPDEVIVVFGVETKNAKLEVAKQEVDAGVKRAIAVAKEMQIDSKDIQTDRLEMQPEYDSNHYRDQPRKVTVYAVRNVVCITLRDVGKCEALISGLLEAGVNLINEVSFRTSKLREHRDKARLMAVQAAKEKAALLAGEFGMKVGKPITIREDSYPTYYGGAWSNRMVQQNVSQEGVGGARDEENTVALGQISASAVVHVTFEVE